MHTEFVVVLHCAFVCMNAVNETESKCCPAKSADVDGIIFFRVQSDW